MISSKCFGYLTLFMAGLSDSLSYFAPRPVDRNVVITKATETEFLASCKSCFVPFLNDVNSLCFLFYLFKNISIYFVLSRHSPHQEEAVSIFEVPDSRAGAGILLQRLHQQGETAAALPNAQPHRPPGQNLVPKQENEREEAEQRSPAVLLRKPPLVSGSGKTSWAVTLRPLSDLAEL